MNISKFIILALAITLSFSSFARKPAVEDFVGVETETYSETPAGTEVSFNFGNHISKSNSYLRQPGNSNLFSLLTFLAFAALPFILWYGITSSIQQPRQVTTAKTNPESTTQTSTPAGVTNLEDYRNTEKEEDVKKAS
jgi:hypothetical protein